MISRSAFFVGGTLVVGLMCVLAPSAGGATASDPSTATPYFVRYFAEKMPLRLEPGSLAIRPGGLDRAAPDRWTDDLAASLAVHGVVEDAGEIVALGSFVRGRLAEPGASVQEREIATRDAVGALAADPGVAFVSPVFIDERGLPLIMTDEILVSIRGREAPGAVLAAFDAQGLEIVERDFAGLTGVYLLRSSSRNGFEVLEQANALGLMAGVLYSEPNAIITGRTADIVVPNDPLFSQQWALDQANDIDLDGPEAWAISTGDASIVVAVLDVGVQFDHPDLNNAPGMDFYDSEPNGGPSTVLPWDNHGTAVAGCISAILDNGIGIVGGAPGVRTASAKIGISINQYQSVRFVPDIAEHYRECLELGAGLGCPHYQLVVQHGSFRHGQHRLWQHARAGPDSLRRIGQFV